MTIFQRLACARKRQKITRTARNVLELFIGRMERMSDDYDYTEGLYRDPAGTLNRLKGEIVKEVVTAYQQHNGMQQFWQGFTKTHPDLEQDLDIANMVMGQNMQELASMSVTEASARIAELTRQRVGRNRQDERELTTSDERDARVMSGGPGHGDPYIEARPVRQGSLGDYLRQRKEARYEASRLLHGRARAE